MKGNIPIPEIPHDHQGSDPVLPRVFTIDIETIVLPAFRERVGSQLERNFRLGNMRLEQQQRYLEDIAAEEERCYQLGSLSAVSGRLLSIAIHVGTLPGTNFAELPVTESEYVFGIDELGNEQSEKETLNSFLNILNDFDPETDEIVGHNILNFDLPFILQRCLVNGISVKRYMGLTGYNTRRVFDTMQNWWLGDRRGRVSLDDLAWALGIESSKTDAAEGSKVFDLYQSGRLNEIREYNLRDVRLTRKIYERMVTCFGR
jgi:DNA polymerase elongation subunit (family B)